MDESDKLGFAWIPGREGHLSVCDSFPPDALSYFAREVFADRLATGSGQTDCNVKIANLPADQKNFPHPFLTHNLIPTTGCCRVLQGAAGCCRMLPGAAGCCRVLQGAAGCCRVLQGAAGCCRVLQGAAGCCRVLQNVVGCCKTLQSTVGRCRALQKRCSMVQGCVSVRKDISYLS